MIRSINIIFLTFCLFTSIAQPAMEVYLFDTKTKKGKVMLSNPRNISNNPGYDNQPAFLADGSGILYSRTRDGQTDVALYDIASESTQYLTSTEGSEYSPTPIPGTSFFSTIVLEKDGTQLLYQYPIDPGDRSLVGPELKIGYHCWFDQNTIYSFVLSDPFTLQESKIKEGINTILANNPGRSLHKIPGKDLISFVDKSDSLSWIISTFDPKTQSLTKLFPTLPGSEDMTWLDGNTILLGNDSKLYQRSLDDPNWKEIFDLQKFNLTGITRVTVHKKKGLLALVVQE